jgi:hypothetical protein
MDRLTITGLNRHLDGDYEFDIADLIGIGQPAMLTGEEAYLIKKATGVRAGELEEALMAGDWDAILGIAAVVMGRHDKRVTVEQLRALPMSQVDVDLEPRKVVAEDDADPPPEVASTLQADGGASGSQTSAPSENDPSRTGLPDSPRSATSVPLTLAH